MSAAYLMAGQSSELERLRLQSRVWEPAGRALLAKIPAPVNAFSLDVGCGAMGWLGVLSAWVGRGGRVLGTDIDEKLLAAARDFAEAGGLANVEVRRDDLFRSELPEASFDLVHARFQIAPLGRGAEQVVAYRRLLKPGGWMVLEDPDMGSWNVSPEAPAFRRLLGLIRESFLAAGGNFDAGRELPGLLRAAGMEPQLDAAVVALPPGHPYLRLPIQFAASLRPRLEKLAPAAELDALLADTKAELARPGTWGTTFTLVQAYAQRPA
jgi:SAM-dependent methyltransferase